MCVYGGWGVGAVGRAVLSVTYYIGLGVGPLAVLLNYTSSMLLVFYSVSLMVTEHMSVLHLVPGLHKSPQGPQKKA